MEPFAKIITNNQKDDQLWGNSDSGRLFVFHLPLNTLVDFTEPSENIKKSTIRKSNSIYLNDVKKEEVTVDRIVELAKSNKINWESPKCYESYVNDTNPFTISNIKYVTAGYPLPGFMFYKFVKKHNSEAILEHADFFNNLNSNSNKNKYILISVVSVVLTIILIIIYILIPGGYY